MDSGPESDALREARRLRDDGRLAAALARLEQFADDGTLARPLADAERSVVLARWRRFREAARDAARAVHGDPQTRRLVVECVETLANHGMPLHGLGAAHFPGEEPAMRKARADVLRSQQRHAEAIPLLRDLAQREASGAADWMALADGLVRTGNDAEALECFRRVVAIDQDHSVAWAHIAAIHSLAGRYDDALAIYESGREFDARIRGQVLANHAITRFRAGDVRGSLELLMSFLPEHPDLNGHMHLGPMLLTTGEYEEGWKQYEFRWMVGNFAMRAPGGFVRPHWNGQDPSGKTVMIVQEQGIGDCFQFARYLPLLKAAGARVVLTGFDNVHTIAKRAFGADALVQRGDPVPDHDFFAYLLSLPRAFGTTVATIPPPLPGLGPAPDFDAGWCRGLPRDGLRVGVVWAGRPEHLRDKQRSMPLAALAPMLALPGITFVGLQKGTPVAQGEALPESVDWIGLGPELDTLEDAIAALDRVDLLVTVDTALAHVAGTLGKPVWMLIANPPDFRWGAEGATTPWYPSMRLFRQRVPGDWSDPVNEIVEALVERRAAREPVRHEPDRREQDPASGVRRVPGLARALPLRHGFLQYDPDEPDVGSSLERYGEWLEPVLGRTLSHLGPGACVVEAMPGIGAHSVAIARRLGESGELMLFEPRAKYRRILENNLRSHALTNATVLERTLGGPTPDAVDPCDTLDGLGLERLDALVMHDAVRSLGPVLEAARETIWRCRPVVVAIAPRGTSFDAEAAALRDLGYAVDVGDVPLHAADNFHRVADDRTGAAARTVVVAVPEERR